MCTGTTALLLSGYSQVHCLVTLQLVHWSHALLFVNQSPRSSPSELQPVILCIHREETCPGVLVCCEIQEKDCLSVSAVPALRVSVGGVLDSRIGEQCTVLVEEKRYSARIAAIGKF